MSGVLGSKLYYSIGEVAELTELAPYTLRAWEGEFACLRPKRVHGKNRAYRQRDIAVILLIRRLLHEERYSTKGAQQRLRNEPELIRAAIEFVERLCAAGEPSLQDLASAGLDQESAAEPVGEPVAAPEPEAQGAGVDPALVREMRDELRAILQLLR